MKVSGLSKLTEEILAANEWVDSRKYSSNKKTLHHIDVFEVDEEGASRLCWAFPHEGKLYGIMEISKTREKMTLRELKDKSYDKYSRIVGVSKMGHAVRTRVQNHLQDLLGSTGTKFYFDKPSRSSFSSLDVLLCGRIKGQDKYLPSSVIERGIAAEDSNTICMAFWLSAEAESYIRSLLTPEEIEETLNKQKAFVDELYSETRAMSCKERPWYVHVQGTDDVSYGLAVASREEADEVCKKIIKEGMDYVCANMEFTN